MNVTVNASWMKVPTADTEGVLGVRIMSDSPIARAIHIGLVLDTSGSMEGERIGAVKRTLSVLIDRLQEGDRISVVGFSNTATRLFNSYVINAANKADAIAAVDKLVADGGTNMEAGIVALGEMFQPVAGAVADKPNALVLLTDGQVNQGIVTTAGLASLLRSYLASVPVYTLGYGNDHNAELLRSISARTQAAYTYINNEIVLPASIGDLLGSLQNEVASCAAVKFPATGWGCLELNPPVETGLYEAGSLIADKPTWIVFSVDFVNRDAPLSLTYKKCGSSDAISVPIVIDESLNTVELTEQFLRCKTARTLGDVTELLGSGNIAQAKTLLKNCFDLLSGSTQTTLVIRMKAQIDEMLEEVTRVENQTPHRAGRRLNFDAMAMRAASTAQNYSAQRGVTGGGTVDAIFSSPAVNRARTQMIEQYTIREDPAPAESL